MGELFLPKLALLKIHGMRGSSHGKMGLPESCTSIFTVLALVTTMPSDFPQFKTVPKALGLLLFHEGFKCTKICLQLLSRQDENLSHHFW